jgi:hypothetical protein
MNRRSAETKEGGVRATLTRETVVQHLKGGKTIIFEAVLSRFSPNISASYFLKYPDTFAIRPFKKNMKKTF